MGRWLICLFVTIAAAAEPLRIQLVTGGHDHELSFYRVFDSLESIARINVNGHPSAFRSDLRSRFDVLVLYDMADVDEEARRVRLREFVEAGKGVVVLHHAICSNQKWTWWHEEVVGGTYFIDPQPGHPKSTYQHDLDIAVERAVREHPVIEGVYEFQIHDELYKGQWISPKVKVLMRTKHPQGDGPLVWIGPHEKSRVVHIQLGHGPEAHADPNFRRLVRNAIM